MTTKNSEDLLRARAWHFLKNTTDTLINKSNIDETQVGEALDNLIWERRGAMRNVAKESFSKTVDSLLAEPFPAHLLLDEMMKFKNARFPNLYRTEDGDGGSSTPTEMTPTSAAKPPKKKTEQSTFDWGGANE